jgi:hypothetical protein
VRLRLIANIPTNSVRRGWKASDWTDSDDRVRGGASQSHLTISGSSARFHGNLDITALGGAGFASQRTTGDDRTWDLSAYDGIYLSLDKHDGKKYTLTLKDEIKPLMEDGREQSTISYEYDFSSTSKKELFVPWHAMKPTYRGKEKDDAEKLDTKNVMRFSIMMRSFFGSQQGDFDLTIKEIKAVKLSGDVEKGVVSSEIGTGVKLCSRGSAANDYGRNRSLGHGKIPTWSVWRLSSRLLGVSLGATAGGRGMI